MMAGQDLVQIPLVTALAAAVAVQGRLGLIPQQPMAGMEALVVLRLYLAHP
jgi:hypothetical protein